MLHLHAAGLQHFQRFPDDARIGGNVLLIDRQHRKASAARNAGDDAVGVAFLAADALQNHRARILGAVSIADIKGNVLLLNRQNRLLMQHGRAHVGQLTQLLIGNIRNGARLFDHLGISHQDARYVRPVLIDIRIQRVGHDCAGNVTAAARHHMDSAIGHYAVKAGHDEARGMHRALCDSGIGFFVVNLPIVIEKYALGRIDKAKAQMFAHQPGGQVFAARNQIIHRDILIELAAQLFKLTFQIIVQPQLIADAVVALLDHGKDILMRHAVIDMRMGQIQQIGDFAVLFMALARGGDHHAHARGIAFDNLLDLAELLGSRQR